MSGSDGGQDWTKTFTNVLGEQYLVQQSDPSSSAAPGQAPSTGSGQADAYSDALTMFNLNAQPIEQIGTDGTKTFTIFDPYTGQPGATWTDVAGTGVFDPGIDPKTVTHETLGGDDNSDDLSTDGSQDDDSESLDGGLETTDTQDGMTTTTVESLPTGPGDYTITTTNPDATKTLDTYTDDLLTQEQQLGTTGAVITSTTYTYDDMRQLATETDSTGTTDFTYYQDGTQDSETDPGQNPQTDNTPDPQAGEAETTTLSDGTTQTDAYYASGPNVGMLQGVTYAGPSQVTETVGYTYDALGRKSSVTDSADPSTGSGEPGTTTYTYDPITGNVASVTSPQGTVNYVYDPATGRLIETWTGTSHASATTDTLYGYNLQGELASVTVAKQNGTAPAAPAAQYAGFDARGDGEPGIGLPTTLYLYDADGNLVKQLNPNGTETDDLRCRLRRAIGGQQDDWERSDSQQLRLP